MDVKGYDRFREKLPALSGKKIAMLPVFVIFMIAAAFATCITFDTLPSTLMSSGVDYNILSFFPLFGVLIVMAVGLALVWQMWLWRDRLKARYGPTSYQRVFLLGFGGVAWILFVAVNQFIPFYSYAPGFWAGSPLRFIATPLEAFLGVAGPMVLFLRYALAVVLTVVGLLMAARALQVFGLDYMTVVYLYFPEESQIQESEIYSALRHPTYAGALMVGLGGTFFTFTPLTFLSYIVFLLGFYIHVRFVEEKELIRRFGDSYRDYRRKVPAFFVSPRKIGAFLRFLSGRG
jgi:protein-S-isoprenylcysteine O-methyltransferase Ste14